MPAEKNASNLGSRLAGLLGALSILGTAYCLAAYVYLRSQLTPAMPDPTPAVEWIGVLALPALAVVGIYHLVLLVRAFQRLGEMPAGRFFFSGYLVAIVVSGMLLATEPVQLLEIGKEYVLFDVSGQWLFLFGSTVFHLAVVTIGFFSLRAAAAGPFDSRSDAFFATMHQVGIFCGVLGILGDISYTEWDVIEQYRAFLILPLSALALLPWGTILAFLLFRNRTKPLSAWFDEKQTADMAVASLGTMMVMLPLLIVLSAFDLSVGLNPPVAFWCMELFFLCLVVFSCAALIRSGGAEEAERAP
jgi:hypothetical protein